MLRDVLEGVALLSVIGGGAGFVMMFGRDRTADEHDLSDYHAEPVDELVPVRHTPAAPWIRPAAALTGPVTFAAWEPKPVGFDGPVPPIARAVLIDYAVPTLSDAAARGIADEWLHEIGEAERAKAGIRPLVSPASDRDFTGGFAVVAVA